MNLNAAQLVFAGVMGGLILVTGLALRYTNLYKYLPTDLKGGK